MMKEGRKEGRKERREGGREGGRDRFPKFLFPLTFDSFSLALTV